MSMRPASPGALQGLLKDESYGARLAATQLVQVGSLGLGTAPLSAQQSRQQLCKPWNCETLLMVAPCLQALFEKYKQPLNILEGLLPVLNLQSTQARRGGAQDGRAAQGLPQDFAASLHALLRMGRERASSPCYACARPSSTCQPPQVTATENREQFIETSLLMLGGRAPLLGCAEGCTWVSSAPCPAQTRGDTAGAGATACRAGWRAAAEHAPTTAPLSMPRRRVGRRMRRGGAALPIPAVRTRGGGAA